MLPEGNSPVPKGAGSDHVAGKTFSTMMATCSAVGQSQKGSGCSPRIATGPMGSPAGNQRLPVAANARRHKGFRW